MVLTQAVFQRTKRENLMEHIEVWQMCIWITDVSWTSTTVLNNTNNCEFLLWSISSCKKKIGKLSASSWPCQATHKRVRYWGHHRIWMDSVATLNVTALTPNHQIFTPFVFFFKKHGLQWHCADTKALQNAMHQRLQRRDSNFCWVEKHGFVSRWKKIIDKGWDYMEK